MDNLFFKKLPGTTLPTVSGNNVVIVEDSSGALRAINAAGPREIADKAWANAELTPRQFTDSRGAVGYFGKDVNLRLSGGTHVFDFCGGGVTLNDNTSKVYVSNSPGLTVSGITGSNWRNVYVDGQAGPIVVSNVTTTVKGSDNIDYRNRVKFTTYAFEEGDVAELDIKITRVGQYEYNMRVPARFGSTFVQIDTQYSIDTNTPFLAWGTLLMGAEGLELERFYPNTADYLFEVSKITVRRHI